MESTTIPVRIFVSYSHEDSLWFDAENRRCLIPWLINSLARYNCEWWFDRRGLEAGDVFERRIRDEIEQADIAILLVSQAFLSSTFIRTVELPVIKERTERNELIALPILLEPCLWSKDEFLNSRQMMPGKPTPLVNYVDSEKEWSNVRFQILEEIVGKVEKVHASRKPVPIRPPKPAPPVDPTRIPPPPPPIPWYRRLLIPGILIFLVLTLAIAVPLLLKFTRTASAPQRPTAGELRVFGSSRMDFVYVPAGTFTMGSDVRARQFIFSEYPPHKVYLDAYWIGKYEVTNRQFDQFIDASGYPGARRWAAQYKPGIGQEELPVCGIFWDDAAAYCRWMGGRLPTEAEWEKAARSTDARTYPWGNDWNIVYTQPRCTAANLADRNTRFTWSDSRVDDGFKGTAPVGSFPQGASPYGVMDMAGNAQEWCADWFEDGYYSHSLAKNPTGPAAGEYRVVRGGSCNSGRDHLASSARGIADKVEMWDTGFRVVIDAAK